MVSKLKNGGVGLGIIVNGSPEPNLVVKQSRKLAAYSLSIASSTTFNSHNSSNFLKTCSLCYNNLHPHKDIYMYRGDKGYCSIKCREKQIDIDEKKELEDSTRKLLASFRQCQEHNPIPHPTLPPLVLL